jgi:undecaprenyl-diphosphatase
MGNIQAIVLGIVQGATEFIPISSSGHLVLVPWLFGWPNPGLAFDTVVHLGTLLAVLAVLWSDLLSLAVAWWHSVSRREVRTPQAWVAWWVILGTIPAALMGMLWEEQFEALFHNPPRVAVLLLVTGLWLTLAEHLGRKERQPEQLGWRESLVIGLAQGCAIAPGISRSGATIGAGVLLGLKRDAATRFSFLLATPIILGAGLLQVKRLLELPDLGASLPPLLLGFVAAFVSGYVCIRFLLAYVKGRSLTVFSVYCWVAGLSAIILYFVR